MARVVRESFRKKADHQQFGGWWTIWNSSRYVTYVKEKQKVGKDSQASNGGFLKWWYLQNTPKWSFLVGKILGNPQATSPKNFQSSKRIGESFDLGGLAFSFGSVGAQPWVSRKRLVFRFPPPCLGLVFFRWSVGTGCWIAVKDTVSPTSTCFWEAIFFWGNLHLHPPRHWWNPAFTTRAVWNPVNKCNSRKLTCPPKRDHFKSFQN